MCIEAVTLCDKALLFSSDLEQSAKHLREALRLDPDAAEAGRALKKVRTLRGRGCNPMWQRL